MYEKQFRMKSILQHLNCSKGGVRDIQKQFYKLIFVEPAHTRVTTQSILKGNASRELN